MTELNPKVGEPQNITQGKIIERCYAITINHQYVPNGAPQIGATFQYEQIMETPRADGGVDYRNLGHSHTEGILYDPSQSFPLYDQNYQPTGTNIPMQNVAGLLVSLAIAARKGAIQTPSN